MMNDPQYLTASVVLSIAFATWLISSQLKKSNSLPLPPGPKRLPIVGHLFTIPLTQQWTAFSQLSKDLDSDIISFQVLGKTIVVLNSNEAVAAVLEKNSLITSDRPYIPFIKDIIKWDWAMAFMDYTPRWKAQRALFHKQLGPSIVPKYWTYQMKATRRLLFSLLNGSKNIIGDIRLLSLEVVITVAYGREVKNPNHPYIHLGTSATHPLLAFGIRPGAFLINFIPALKYVPEWFPGAGFQKQGRVWKEAAQKFYNIPFADVKQDIRNGTAGTSFVSSALADMDNNNDIEDQETNIKHVAASMFSGGVDTTLAVVANAMLTLLHHSDVVKKAQEELDCVIGLGNLPEFTDMESLPYITAVVKECIRWRDPAPLAFVHVASEELTYKGYRIPKGANIMGNVWACQHDENYFDNPEVFKPERYLTPDGKLNPSAPDPETTIWGFGRRICPGRALAMNSIWISVASILAAFHFERVDETAGPDHPFLYDNMRVPLDFNAKFTPRCKEVEKLIRESMYE